MEINRAKEIISALAEGIDPITGEVLPDDSVCNKGEVVRALYTILRECESKMEKPKAVKVAPDKYDTELYEMLKDLRNKIAAEKKIAVFMVLANASLKHMAAQKPTTKDEFLKIYGVGDRKAQQYSGIFINEIKKYLGKNTL